MKHIIFITTAGILAGLIFSSCGKKEAAPAAPAPAPAKSEAPKAAEAPKPAPAPAPQPAPAPTPTPAPVPAPTVPATPQTAPVSTPPPAPTPAPAPAPAPAPGGGGGAVMNPAEQTAVDKFKAELLAAKNEVEVIMKEGDKAAAENPMAALVPMKMLCNRIQQIKAEGLPAELGEAWKGMSVSFAKMADIFKDFPDKPEEMTGWIVKNVGTDPAALNKWQGEFNVKLQAVQEAGDAAVKKFEALAPKYGIDPNMMK